MNRREQLEETVAVVLIREQSSGACTLGVRCVLCDCDGASEYYARRHAQAVVDALLPQVTTVEELTSADDGTLAVDVDGRPWRKRGWRWETWARKQVTVADLVRHHGPLMVVWTP